MTTKNIGSFWSKWDLHVHTPASIIEHYGKNKENIWEDYITDLNNLPDNITVLGINDYLFLEGYEIVKRYFDEGKLPKIKKIFPVIELRLKIFGNQTKSDPWHRINFHVIFSDELDVKTIQAQFISGLSAHYNLLPENKSFWNGVLTKESLEDFGKMIIENSTVEITESPIEVGFNSLNFTEEAIFKLLGNHYFKEKYLTAIGKTEWEKLRWDGSIGEKLSIINSVDFVFCACESIEAYNNSENALKAQVKEFNLLDCSDAHYFSTSTEKDRIGNCNLWIKAEPTFEGLKQLKYEPVYRKSVSLVEPRKPYRTLESIKFNFPEHTKLKNNQTNSEQPFCLSELKEEIYFSPYFTCIIGGRGSGKSTIINIIAEKLGEKTEFFQNNKIIVNENTDVLKNYENSCITIDGTNEIEFISQGKVEKLSDGGHLTDLIFNERIKAIGNEYEEKEKLLLSKFQAINDSIKIVIELERLNSILITQTASLDNDKKIIASIENETYKELSTKVNQTSIGIERITNSKNQYNEFLTGLVDLMMSPDIKDATDQYADRIKEIITELEKIEELTKIENGYRTSKKIYTATDTLLEEKKNELASLKQQVIDYFTSIGSTPDSIADVDRATSNIAIVSNEIAETEKKIHLKNEQLKGLIEQTSDIKDLATQCEEIITKRLKKINEDLDIQNENVEKIKFEFQFDNDKFLNRLYKDFNENFKSYQKPNLSWDNIYSCLRELIKPNEQFLNLTFEQFQGKLALKSFERNSLYGRVFLEIFEKKSNFEIYSLLVKKNLYNVSDNIEIIGYYGKSPLTSCSFGQRCTAVVVTLLMTGMKPLLIDEPEAHLDNRLIAEYLVDLIKQKKNERQIIFATHNANFVVNGDAELIHILEIPKEKVFTEITSTTIENLTHRKSLLKLEGGEEAFKKRDKKLLSSV
jgi:ABC-type lipoprotein export system ATPase subunit